MRRILALSAILLLCILPTSWAASMEQEIEQLLQYVGNSDAVFIRNGKEYTSAEAVEHIKTKRNYFKSRIHSTEDFIRLCATKSLMSGEAYQVRTRDGKVEEVGNWLTDEVRRYRQQKP